MNAFEETCEHWTKPVFPVELALPPDTRREEHTCQCSRGFAGNMQNETCTTSTIRRSRRSQLETPMPWNSSANNLDTQKERQKADDSTSPILHLTELLKEKHKRRFILHSCSAASKVQTAKSSSAQYTTRNRSTIEFHSQILQNSVSLF